MYSFQDILRYFFNIYSRYPLNITLLGNTSHLFLHLQFLTLDAAVKFCSIPEMTEYIMPIAM